ncbi:sensor histidine kinase [Amycolatopsis pigmentata]|uniref:histidine kinase n=1 Tax=Amycolatopsis pigmentata TaxID=450801 RepID=A0ABW5FVZ3_9PSEU
MPFSQRLSSAWRWLGLEGAVLLAALLCDLFIIFPAAFDDIGPKGRDLLLLPGMLAFGACALWGRRRPVKATFAGATVLVFSGLLDYMADVAAYSTLFRDVSLSETVAGLELVFLCVRRGRILNAFAAVSTLVFATLCAIVLRGHRTAAFGIENLITGGVLLAAVVVVGMRLRNTEPTDQPTRLSRLLNRQWPLIGGMCLPMFLDLYNMLQHGVRTLPLAALVVAAAAIAVISTRRPMPAALALCGVILLSAAAVQFVRTRSEFPAPSLPFTEVLAGLVVVVQLVRYLAPRRAWTIIGALSLSVAVSTALSIGRPSYDPTSGLRSLASYALLLLGIAVAVGLYFRARDSERAKVVEAAVTEAQTSERMALARELHDVVAHHVTGIVVQAQAAKMMGEQNPALAIQTLGQIEVAGTDALTAMRRLVRSMRSHDEESQLATTDLAADLRRLAETGHHGVPTVMDLRRLPPGVPHEVGRSALRLVQESLTNIGKHAPGATQAWVLAEVVSTDLHIKVIDNGRIAQAPPEAIERARNLSGGYGLVGMRERVELLRGRLVAGPVSEGWLVEAWLPLEGAPTA